jgi:hypothetical protein
VQSSFYLVPVLKHITWLNHYLLKGISFVISDKSPLGRPGRSLGAPGKSGGLRRCQSAGLHRDARANEVEVESGSGQLMLLW